MASNAPQLGAVLGKYRVLSLLGQGGMGTVYRGQNMLTGKEVALKWMNAGVTLESGMGARLLREAQVACRLSHPNVVNVFDLVQEDDTLFMVMELLHGETLRDYMARDPRAEIAHFLELLLPAIDAVEAAHECGVIHRDLKPDNIFLARPPGAACVTVKVLDFGVAKVMNSENIALTSTGAPLGTPLYMSLEQLRGVRDVDKRTDVFAFGVILYEAVTGQLPHSAPTLTELAILRATKQPTSVSELRPDVPASLAEVIQAAIARDRDQRLPDLRALLSALAPFTRDACLGSTLTREPPLIAHATSRTDASTPRRAEGTQNTFGHSFVNRPPSSAWSFRNQRLFVLAAGALGLLGGLAYHRVRGPFGALAVQEEQLVRPAPVTEHTSILAAPSDDPADNPASALPSDLAAAGQGPNAVDAGVPFAVQPPGAAPRDSVEGQGHEGHEGHESRGTERQPAAAPTNAPTQAKPSRKKSASGKTSHSQSKRRRNDALERDLKALGGRM